MVPEFMAAMAIMALTHERPHTMEFCSATPPCSRGTPIKSACCSCLMDFVAFQRSFDEFPKDLMGHSDELLVI